MYTYGIRLAVIYSMVWFIDLLDATSLNVSLASIAESFHITALDANWAVIGFFLAMTIGISISGWLADAYSIRSIFLFAQVLYIASSIGCGISRTLWLLIACRIVQGFAGGIAIPLGMLALMKAMPQAKWAKMSASMNLVTLVAPALGPVFGAYVTSVFGWPWIFFLKLPLLVLCFALSLLWVRKDKINKLLKFDWKGFFFGGVSLTGFLYAFSQIDNENPMILSIVLVFAALFGLFFLRVEKRQNQPLIDLAIFKNRHFSYGNIIQSAANTIFLGANFLIALYLQKGLGFDLVTTGWVMAAITPSMMLVQPVVGRLYNRFGPIPFILPGLILLSCSTFAFIYTTPCTSPYVLAALVFCIGAGSATLQTANVVAIFSGVSSEYKATASSLYALCKQLSASFGVALSTMILSVGTSMHLREPLQAYHVCFIVLGLIPAMAVFLCRKIDNTESIRQVQATYHTNS